MSNIVFDLLDVNGNDQLDLEDAQAILYVAAVATAITAVTVSSGGMFWVALGARLASFGNALGHIMNFADLIMGEEVTILGHTFNESSAGTASQPTKKPRATHSLLGMMDTYEECPEGFIFDYTTLSCKKV